MKHIQDYTKKGLFTRNGSQLCDYDKGLDKFLEWSTGWVSDADQVLVFHAPDLNLFFYRETISHSKKG